MTDTTFAQDLLAGAIGGSNEVPVSDGTAPGIVKEEVKLDVKEEAVPVKDEAKEDGSGNVVKEEGGAKEDAPSKEAEEEAAEPDMADKYLEALRSKDSKAPELDDTAKAALKARGIEDIDALIQERATDREQAAQYKEKADLYDTMQEALKDLPLEIGEAIEAFRKGEDYTKALSPLTKGITMNKAAKDIDPVALVKHEFPNKLSEEQFEAIKSGDADEATTSLFDGFHELASSRHDARRGAFVERENSRRQAGTAYKEAADKAIAAAIAHAKEDKATATLLTPELLSDFKSGRLIEKLLQNPDGTPSLSSLALLAKAVNHEIVVTRAMKGAAAKAKVEGGLEVLGRMPTKPSGKDIPKKTPDDNRGLPKELVEAQDLLARAMG